MRLETIVLKSVKNTSRLILDIFNQWKITLNKKSSTNKIINSPSCGVLLEDLKSPKSSAT